MGLDTGTFRQPGAQSSQLMGEEINHPARAGPSIMLFFVVGTHSKGLINKTAQRQVEGFYQKGCEVLSVVS